MMEKNLRKKKESSNGAGSNRSTPASAARMASNALTKSADNKSRASSSKSITSSIGSVTKSQNDFGNGLDVTKPELITGYDLRAHLQQIMRFSDDDEDDDDDMYYSSDDDESIESFDDKDDRDDELRKLALEAPEDGQTRTPLPTGMNNCQSLVPISEEEGEDLDSEEENEIMKEIRNEITNNIRQEMKSELELYQAKMKKLEGNADGTSGVSSGEQGSDSKGNLHADLEDLDPKLKNAIIKMRKLDKILSKRVRREKEVKRDRILLERRLRREIEEIHKEKKDEYKEVLNNEHKFLALELPPRHNEGVTVPDEFTGEEVFATQLNEDDYPGLHPRNKSRKAHSRSTHKSHGDSERHGSDDEKSRGDASSVASGSTEGRKHKKKRKKDFIKRNKELAADASNAIAMTEEEKKRLDDLLKDVANIPDIPEHAELDESNPFQLAVKPGEGFVPDPEELRSLTSIDSRLKELMPPDDYQSIASSSMSHLPQNKLFTHTGVKHPFDWENRGERALFQNAEQREMNERMLAIEDELARLKNPEDELETPRLGEDQLQDLIEQCVTSLSMTSMSRMTLNTESRTSFADTESVVSHAMDGTVDNTPRSPRSARQEILDNPPKLAPEVLQKLLSEAYHPLSKQLSTLKEVEDEEEEETSPIPSEVWKLISMETVDESQTIDSIRESLDTQNNGRVLDSVSEKTNRNDIGSNNVSARNGFRTLSRNSSASSLASVSDLGTGRETKEKEPFRLPEIDPSGSLVTQGLNNQRRPGSNASARTPVNMVHNSFSDSVIDNMGPSDSRLELMSLDGEIISPHPPSRERREGSGHKSRTVTPANRSNVT
ncbi:fibrous sheath-interacting protein 1-like [Mercenaria mercenaria]|uniref:fibrous sheath-interacting protein 1-like n=1 Tax=Mercenaria mercenaria TaxID=6596 RepID=UPI00234EAB85|nr:fibrous sheath-interacting protein 1-like [Mercenaria mercenaria]